MPAPSTSGPNADTFLSAFGPDVATLPDTTTVEGIFKSVRESYFDGPNAITRQAYRFWFPTVHQGALAQDQQIIIGHGRYNVVYLLPDADGWTEATLAFNGAV